jgi:hypothetical protein
MSQAAAAVTPGEANSYRNFAIDQLAKTGRHPVGELFHYTTGEGLIGILESGELWATQVSCLNDSSEIRYALSMLRGFFTDKVTDPGLDLDEKFVCERVVEDLSVDGALTSEWFVACFTEEKDDLSQWRAYGRGEGGYAIGFDNARLQLGIAPEGSHLAVVCYDKNIHMQIARDSN